MQAQCIANGDTSIQVTGVLDDTTQKSLQHFANIYGVHDSFDSFEMYKALELNRRLDTSISRRAWIAYQNFKRGTIPAPSPAPAETYPPKQNNPPPVPRQAPTPSSNYEDDLSGLL